MSPKRPLQKLLPALVLASCLFALYLATMAPGLTWANDGSDGGDLITAAATSGIPHPTGYPLYLLLARAFQFLPAGSLAFRTNLLSACATALAAGLLYLLVWEASSDDGEHGNRAAALAAGCAFGLAPLVWSQAVITEVYGLQALLVALIFYLYAPAASHPSLDHWRGLALGLAVCNHATSILLVPAGLGLGSIRLAPHPGSEAGGPQYPNLKPDRARFLRQLGMFGLGLSLYLILPIRAMGKPPVNWGNVVTVERFWWLVSGQLYQNYLQFSPAVVWQRTQSCAAALLQQFGLPGILLGLIGLVLFWEWSRLHVLSLWTAALSAVFAVLYGSEDSYIYLMPLILSFAVWIGLGTAGLSKRFAAWSAPRRIVFALLLISYFVNQALTHVSQVDAAADARAELFGRDVLSRAPEGAILFAEGDRAVFALWYFHFALHERQDLAILAADLLHFDWYQENLRAAYPFLVLPAPPFVWPETVAVANPSRPACFVRDSDGVVMDCLPPAELSEGGE